MAESILESIKTDLAVCYDEFDSELIMYINSAIAELTLAGVGPKSGFRITGSTETWTQLTEDKTVHSLCEQFIHLKTKLMWDSPNNSFATSAIEQELPKLLYAINLKVDCPPADRDGIWVDD